MADAFPMIGLCLQHQLIGIIASESIEGANDGPNLLLNNGERTTQIMIIKWLPDSTLEHVKKQLDEQDRKAAEPLPQEVTEQQYADV